MTKFIEAVLAKLPSGVLRTFRIALVQAVTALVQGIVLGSPVWYWQVAASALNGWSKQMRDAGHRSWVWLIF